MTDRRARRTREDLRRQLLESALVEFAAKGFDGASTRSIALRVDAHQPQINYHFESKEALWATSVDHLFDQLIASLGDLDALSAGARDPQTVGEVFGDALRRFVHFAAAHPELNRIMVHEATADSDRLHWMTERHVRPIYDAVRSHWALLVEAGIAAPIDPATVHYVIVGAASLLYVNGPEAVLLSGSDPAEPERVDRHADALVRTLLPGLSNT